MDEQPIPPHTANASPEVLPPAQPVAQLLPATPAPPKDSSAAAFAWTRDLLISAAISILIITFLYQPVRVEGTSMLPRLEDRDRLFINKFVYHFESIHRLDVVVFHYPLDPSKSYIKRIIGLPGDHVMIDHGRVWVNGAELAEAYVPQRYRDLRSMPEFVVPAESYWVMGDHRSISSDSREFGPVERDLIYGKAVFVYWPARDAGVVR